MLREYKFRGKDIHTDEYVYGYFKRNLAGDFCIADIDGWEIVVVPESVVPLVGHDIAGEEVYEGDWLWDENSEVYFQVQWDEDAGGFTLSGYDCWYDEYINKIGYYQLTAPPENYEEE